MDFNKEPQLDNSPKCTVLAATYADWNGITLQEQNIVKGLVAKQHMTVTELRLYLDDHGLILGDSPYQRSPEQDPSFTTLGIYRKFDPKTGELLAELTEGTDNLFIADPFDQPVPFNYIANVTIQVNR